MQGRIKLHRQIQDRPEWWSEPFTRWQARIDLVLLANHSEGFFYVRGNKVTVKRGQVWWSEIRLSEKRHWSRNKLRRWLKELETIQQIEQQKSPILSLITITNYEKYQWNDTTDDTTERQQTIQQKDTNNNDKKEKKEKEWKEILSKDNTANAEYGNKEINNLITLLKDKCSQQWIIYSADPSERNYAKHLLSKKFSANLIEFWMSMEEFVWNIVKLSTQPYTKQVNNCKKFYYNRWDVINQSKNNMKKEPQTKIFTV